MGTITINGNTYSGNNISICNGSVVIDGVEAMPDDSKTIIPERTGNKAIYSGCARSVVDCLQSGKLRFGKYPSSNAVEAALFRCEQNTPRFISTNDQNPNNQSSNKSGLYVCYDKKVISGSNAIYIGCSREEGICQDRGKYHFGKYPSDLKARQAYDRCSKSNPKFVDSQGI